MSNQKLDEARALEALRICKEQPAGLNFRELAQTAARLARVILAKYRGEA